MQCQVSVLLYKNLASVGNTVFVMLYWSLKRGFHSESCLVLSDVGRGVQSIPSEPKGFRLKDVKMRGEALQGQSIDPLQGGLSVFRTEIHNLTWIVCLFLKLFHVSLKHFLWSCLETKVEIWIIKVQMVLVYLWSLNDCVYTYISRINTTVPMLVLQHCTFLCRFQDKIDQNADL